MTCDYLVTYCRVIERDDDAVFKALADGTRRHLLDLLFTSDGQSLSELEAQVPDMTRFGVMKHLQVLETANLVVSHKQGRQKLHYLNPVPIQAVYDRWIDKFTATRLQALTELQRTLESSPDQEH